MGKRRPREHWYGRISIHGVERVGNGDERFAMIQLGGAVPVKDYSIFEDFEIIELTGEIPD